MMYFNNNKASHDISSDGFLVSNLFLQVDFHTVDKWKGVPYGMADSNVQYMICSK